MTRIRFLLVLIGVTLLLSPISEARGRRRATRSRFIQHTTHHYSGKMSYYTSGWTTASTMRFYRTKPTMAAPKATGIELLTPVRVGLENDPEAGRNLLVNDRGPAAWTGFAFDGTLVARDLFDLREPGSRPVHVRVIGPPLSSKAAAYAYLAALEAHPDAIPGGSYEVHEWVAQTQWYQRLQEAEHGN